MMMRRCLCLFGWIALVALVLPSAGHAATVTTGGLAIIGYNDNNGGAGGEDSFAVLATEDIVAGTVIYFTNNAWNNNDDAFMGSGMSPNAGDGFEQLMRLQVTGSILAGTIFSSTSTSANYSWDTSSSIAGVASSAFSHLELKFPGSYSDEIYIFQASDADNPLLTPSNFIYVLNFGDANDPGFNEPLSTYDVGSIPNGSVGNRLSDTSDEFDPQVWDNTAVLLDPEGDWHEGWFGLDLSDAAVVALNATGGTKAAWLALINAKDGNGNNLHWARRLDASLPTGMLDLTPDLAPEPSRCLLAMGGMGIVLLRRRRLAVRL